jgi:hypothetical protein
VGQISKILARIALVIERLLMGDLRIQRALNIIERCKICALGLALVGNFSVTIGLNGFGRVFSGVLLPSLAQGIFGDVRLIFIVEFHGHFEI